VRSVYLLDTNIVSEPLKPKPHPEVLKRMRSYDGVLCIASIVWHELLFGMTRLAQGAQQRRIQAYLFDVVAPAFPVVDYTGSAASIHATIRAHATASGKALSFADGIIAATALANNLLLVTRNTQDFESIPGLYIENWFE